MDTKESERYKIVESTVYKRDWKFAEGDYVAQKIEEIFESKSLHVTVYSNDEWSLYEYSLMKGKDGITLEMNGKCLVCNETKECYTCLVKDEKSSFYEPVYFVSITDKNGHFKCLRIKVSQGEKVVTYRPPRFL